MPSASEIGRAIISTRDRLSPTAGGAMRRVIEAAIDGAAGMPGARVAAANHLGKAEGREEAIDSLVSQHVSLAGAQGFVTNIGGVLAMAVSVPANMVGVSVIQCRMVAAIAHLRGYDLDDNRVRSAILMCLLGERTATELVQAHTLPSTPMAIATAPAFDPDLDRSIADQVVSQLLTQVGGKKLGLLMAKRIPFVGGGVGAVTDGWATYTIASYARREFADRRHRG